MGVCGIILVGLLFLQLFLVVDFVWCQLCLQICDCGMFVGIDIEGIGVVEVVLEQVLYDLLIVYYVVFMWFVFW